MDPQTAVDRNLPGATSSAPPSKAEPLNATASKPPQGQSRTQEPPLPAQSSLTSTLSLDTTRSSQSKKEYLDSLVPPSKEEFERISETQGNREAELRRRSRELQRRSREHSPRQSLDNQSTRRHESIPEKLQRAVAPTGDGRENASLDDLLRVKAATLIQRTYRGYRARREMKGLGINATTRWVHAIREAQFREAIRPRAREETGQGNMSPAAPGEDGPSPTTRSVAARNNWKRAAIIARRAAIGEDSTSDSDSSSTESSDENNDPKQKEARLRRREANARRRQVAKTMGLQYFLEMVDLKHRYGSNLRRYHEEWKRSDTKENFFYWLDYGAGRFIEVDSCPRERLDKEQVRYLSREERQYYLVKVDQDGRLCWAKNGARIDTTEEWKDSIHGIVPLDDTTPQFHGIMDHLEDTRTSTEKESDTDPDHHGEGSEAEHDHRHATGDAEKGTHADHNGHGPQDDHSMKHVHHVSASAIIDKILRRSVKKNTWIFVADTSFRLYVGIKTSGAFQHSSFLQGSRISAAGIIKIKNGRLSSLSPLSGHYRPPASNFRAFVRSMREAGVDMSHVAISKSYAVLVGLEVYVKARRKVKAVVEKMHHHKEKITDPAKARRREEVERDQSESAKKEREFLAQQEREREANKAAVQLLQKLHITPREPAGQKGAGDNEEENATAAVEEEKGEKSLPSNSPNGVGAQAVEQGLPATEKAG